MLADEHPALGHTESERLPLDLQAEPFDADGVVVADDALALLRKDLVQICSGVGNKGRARLLGRDGEAFVVSWQVVRQEGVGLLASADACLTHLLREPALKRSVRAFASASRLR